MTDWKFPQVKCYKARKTYTCSMCDSLIHPREKYCRVVDVDRGTFVIDRYCMPCDTALLEYILEHELKEDDFLPDVLELHQFLIEKVTDEDEENKEAHQLLFQCLARLNKKLGWEEARNGFDSR